ncbi:MAG: glycosyltransferase [Rhodospirillales bacterium]|nr:glycosyltransferase [Rhodospirillales bacterium]
MPVYNGEQFLAQALSSIRNQIFRNWVLIISDDGSCDGSDRIIRSFSSQDSRISVRQQPQNLGQLGNFGYLLDSCRTPYFMWHCQDDWIEPNYLETLLSVLSSNPGCTLACGDSKRVAVDGQVIKHKPFPGIDPDDRLQRVRLLLDGSDATRIFGLFVTEALRRPFADAIAAGYVWGWDPLTLLPFILNDRLRGTNETCFYWRDTGLSAEKYKPRGVRYEMRFLLTWLQFHLRQLNASSLTTSQKLACFRALLAHLAERSGVSPYKLYLRPLLRSFRP